MPPMISSVSPKARIVVIEIWRDMLEKFATERKAGLRSELTTTMTTRIRYMLY
jgi:hypothetical protein